MVVVANDDLEDTVGTVLSVAPGVWGDPVRVVVGPSWDVPRREALENRVAALAPVELLVVGTALDGPGWDGALRELVPGRDVAVLRAGFRAAPGWLAQLRAASLADGARLDVAGNPVRHRETSRRSGWLSFAELGRLAARSGVPATVVARESLPDLPACVYLVEAATPGLVRDVRVASHVLVNDLRARQTGTDGVVRATEPDDLGAWWVAAERASRAPQRVLTVTEGLEELPSGFSSLAPLLAEQLEVFWFAPQRPAPQRLRVLADGGWKSAQPPVPGAEDVDAAAITSLLVGLGIESVHMHGPVGPFGRRFARVARALSLQVVVELGPQGPGAGTPELLRRELVTDVVVADVRAASSVAESSSSTVTVHTLVPGVRREQGGTAVRERPAGPIRVAVLASSLDPEDLGFWSSVARTAGPEVEWHLLGRWGTDDVAWPGPAGRCVMTSEVGLVRQLAEVAPDLVVLGDASATSHPVEAITQVWSEGRAVLTTSRSGLGDEVARLGVGRVVDVEGPERAALDLLGVARAVSGGARLRDLDLSGTRSAWTSAEDYRALFRRGSSTRALARPTIGYVVWHPRPGVYPATAAIRVLSRIRSERAAEQYDARLVDAWDFVSGRDETRYDAVVVQRDALPAREVDAFVTACRDRGSRLVVEIDDDLVSDHAVAHLEKRGLDGDRLRAIRTLLERCDGAVVSTPTLVELIGGYGCETALFPNTLDPRLWSPEVGEELPPTDEEVRLLYAGSLTHGRDLAMIEALPGALSDRLGREVVLELIGVADVELGRGLRRLQLPSGLLEPYVRWVRANAARWSVALAPLEDDEFTRSKSDIKLLEYSRLGLPVVASRNGPYASWSDERVVLVDNDLESWVAAVAGLLTEPDHARGLQEAATSYVAAERMLTADEVDRWSRFVLGGPVGAADS